MSHQENFQKCNLFEKKFLKIKLVLVFKSFKTFLFFHVSSFYTSLNDLKHVKKLVFIGPKGFPKKIFKNPKMGKMGLQAGQPAMHGRSTGLLKPNGSFYDRCAWPVYRPVMAGQPAKLAVGQFWVFKWALSFVFGWRIFSLIWGALRQDKGDDLRDIKGVIKWSLSLDQLS